MMHFAKTLKSAALASLVGLGFVVATVTPANAERAYTKCDRDGDRCWRVKCDWDGDDCRRTAIRTGWQGGNGNYYDPTYRVERRYYDRDRERFYRNHHFDYRSGMWVCDGSSEYCRWSARHW